MTLANARASADEPKGAGNTPRPHDAATLLPRRPYPGLRPFEKEEWPIFRGRDRLIQDILTILAENHFVSILGPSGSGKSSLVRAGVLATLERRHSRMGVRWRTGTMRPGASPLWAMADGILRALRPEIVGADGELPAAEVARIRVLIDASEDGLASAVQEVGLEEDTNFLLLVDQFEEIFRYTSDDEDREQTRLIEILLAVAENKPSGIHIITTMRSEYLGDCSRFKGLAETLNETHYLLSGMTEDELRQAIVEPAELKNGHIEDGLVERLVEDIRGQEDQLPILQHTLLWMWIQEEERLARQGLGGGATVQLGLAAYEELESSRRGAKAGNVRNALSYHGNRILEGMSPKQRRIAQIMFRRLVAVEEHSNRLRRPTQCSTVARLAQVPLEVLQDVIDAFRADDASFIFASKRHLANDTSIDIMHESLIRQWDTLDRWVRREKASYEVYNDLCRAARRMRDGGGTLLTGLAMSRAQHWVNEEHPTPLWARRYGGDYDAAMRFLTESEEAEDQRLRAMKEAEEAARRQEEERLRLQNELEQQALRARLEEQIKLGLERRRYTRLATIAAAVCFALTLTSFWGLIYAQNQAARADNAALQVSASSFLHRLRFFRDPIELDTITALWDLTPEEEEVRVELVRQLMDNPALFERFGSRTQPIIRAIGLKWPEAAREIVKEKLAYVASDQFDPSTADPSDLATYARALGALRRFLDPAVALIAAQKLASGVNGLAALQEELSDRELRAMVDVVGVFDARLDPAAIAPAQDRLRREISESVHTDPSSRRTRVIGRAIEIMSPNLNREERQQAVQYLVPLLGQDFNSWSAKAMSRAMAALLPTLDPDQASEAVRAIPPAIAMVAVAKSDGDDSYLLALIQIVETLARTDDPAVVEAFGQALAAQLARTNQPAQRAALARAALPLLENRNASSASALFSTVAAVALLPAQGPADGVASADTEGALRQALSTGDDAQTERQSDAALRLLQTELNAKPLANAQLNPYRRAVQVRLLETLAPSLTEKEGTTAAADLRSLLARTEDYLTRDAIARTFGALSPKLPNNERNAALAKAKLALAKTGSYEEATAWARAITALLPAEPRSATAEIVEALKYPTATDKSSDILLAAMATVWPKDYEAIAGKTLPDQIILDWLQDHLPAGVQLTDPPPRPPSEPADAGPLRR